MAPAEVLTLSIDRDYCGAGQRTTENFFERYLRCDATLTDLSALGDLLPEDPADLRDIQMHCLRAARDASSRIEMRRLDILARELGKLARRRARQR
jgi:hypothetical protein